ncbi:MAG: UDP-N-acetylmuramate dehydrogenase [Lautropia sp.]|nr:UDP-N-acetylmuramate dehydrogenase [Lautropia sp.]
MSFNVQRQLNLQPLNTFGIAATARVVYTLDDTDQLDALLAALATETQQTGRRPLILSGGSNMLFARDLDEPVLCVRTRGRQQVDRRGDTVLLDVAAGEIWHDTVRWSLTEGYSGLENLALIPGRVGAAPWQNIGAYGVEVGEQIDSVEALHLQSGERRRFTAADCAFGYRQSFFKSAAGRDWLILSVRLRLSCRFEPRLGYGELAQALQARTAAGATLDARLVADTVEAIRRRKLPDPAVLGNAGSFFHNPVVPGPLVEELRQRHPDLPAHRTELPATRAPTRGHTAAAGDEAIGHQPLPADQARPLDGTVYKLSAGWLIDRCGWKGHREGDAGVSANHALVLVNHGHATGRQMLALARRIQHSVLERFGVQLHPEPVILR